MSVKSALQTRVYLCIVLVSCGLAACEDAPYTANEPQFDPDGSRFFDNLQPILEDTEDPAYCNPTDFDPTPNTDPLPQECDPNTDASLPCIVELYAYDEPVVCDPDSATNTCNQRTSYYAPQNSTWSCDVRPPSDPLDAYEAPYAWLLPDMRRHIADNTMIPPAVFDEPSDDYTDVLNDRGQRTARFAHNTRTPGYTTPPTIYYTYDDQDRITAWAIAHGAVLYALGRTDTNGTLRTWTRPHIDFPSMQCTAYFNSTGRFTDVSCDDLDDPLPTYYNESYDCRGILTGRGGRMGERYPSYTAWTYDDFGRLTKHIQENSIVYEEYTATYAQNPAQPIALPPCGVE